MNRLLTNSPGNDLPVVSIVIALFLLVTVYYALLFTTFNLPVKKLVVSYAIIIILLITILLISRYYLTFFNTYETFIANYTSHSNNDGNKNKNNGKHEKLTDHLVFKQSPFAPIYDVDKMCESKDMNVLDREDISWKCRVRDDYGHDSFSLKPQEDEVESSIQYKLKYDGIYDISE
jgi:uncharacterized membrane protein YwzB